MIDFTNCIKNYKYYSGADRKISITYNSKDYLLKFPNYAKDNKEASYTNNDFSEYIGCHIFNIIGIKAQETILGKYYYEDGTEKDVVACLDFNTNNMKLTEFSNFQNSYIDISNSSGKVNNDLNEIIETITNHSDLYNREEVIKKFWDMFIVDALLGNFDRHSGNWGFLIDEKEKKIEFSPIYDCGSCLYPQLLDNQMENILNSDEEIDKRVYVFPNSALKIDNAKINYYNYISSLENDLCNEALLRIFPEINLNKINEFIDNISEISEIRKLFYKKMLKERYNKILKYSYDKLINK